MKKNFIIRLLLLVAVSVFLYSCVHDEIASSTDPASKEYTNKSLWKEDEKYIKNVMKVYYEHEVDIKKISGTPYWDYASTMETYDESFLMVPIVDQGKVVSILQVPRDGITIHFYYTNFRNQIDFFQKLVFSEYKKALPSETSSPTSKLTLCTRQSISVWLPNDESNPEAGGHWQTSTIIKCVQHMDQCVGVVNANGVCEGGGGSGGYPYPGGDDPQDPEKDPCKKAKSTYNSTAVKSRYDVLKTKVGDLKETGYGFTTITGPKGLPTTQTNPLNPDATNPDKMKVGIYPTTFGYSHTHINKSNGNVSVKIFSPADINTFLIILHNAIANNTPLDTVFGGMVASDPDTVYNTYQIQYTGNGTNLPSEFTKEQLDVLRNWYAKNAQEIQTETGELSHTDMQKLFNETLKKMNLSDIVLFKIEGNSNTVKKVDYNGYGSPSENNCS
ncbi:hypothetical protein [Chryseobacterium polytrichastri]|nr:hypothetical protein [Chryseobacterium polytrichastri]